MPSRETPAEIRLSFDLPVCLYVDGGRNLKVGGRVYRVRLSTVRNPNPQVPGMEVVQGATYINDDTNTFGHTHVELTIKIKPDRWPGDILEVNDELSEISFRAANHLIGIARAALGLHALPMLMSSRDLGPVGFDLIKKDGSAYSGGAIHWFPKGGFTNQPPQHSVEALRDFASRVEGGLELSLSEQLIGDARRYQLSGNARMALVNLSISFEVFLSEMLIVLARESGMDELVEKVESAALNELGQKFAKKLLGSSLDSEASWGGVDVETYKLLRVARNSVLHKGKLLVEMGGSPRNFEEPAELEGLFGRHDTLRARILSVTAARLGELKAANVRSRE